MTARKSPSEETRAKISASVRRRFAEDADLRAKVRAGGIKGGAATAEKMRQNPAATCPKGHPFTEANTYWLPDGSQRRCRTCKRRSTAQYLIRKRAEARGESA